MEDLLEYLLDHDRIQVYLSSNRLRSAHTRAPVTVGGWRDTMRTSQQILDVIQEW